MQQSKKFASQADLEEKNVSFTQISKHAWAYTAEGDPNTGIIIGDDAVLVADTQATPAMADDVIRRIREVTDKPIRTVVFTHGHADHTGGLQHLGDLTRIVAHERTALALSRGAGGNRAGAGAIERVQERLSILEGGQQLELYCFG